MRGQVVHGDERPAGCQRQPLGELAADQQAADQARPHGGRHGTKLAGRDAGLGQCRVHQTRQVGKVRARGDLGHHALPGGVLGGLAQQCLGQDLSVRRQDGGGRLVAAGLDAQHWSQQWSMHGEGVGHALPDDAALF
jgi:hypothetical protein